MLDYDLSQISCGPVAEGVRFRLGTSTALAVRRPERDISLRIRRERRPLRDAARHIPFLRGMVRFVLFIADLLDGINESSEMEPQRITRGTRFEQRVAALFRVHPASLVALGSALMAVLLLAGGLLGLPMAVEAFALPHINLTRHGANLIVSLVRALGLVLGLGLTLRLRVVNRLCMYQGAANKAINAYLSGQRVTEETARRASPLTRRCDGAFVTLTLIFSLVAFAAIRTYTLPVQLLVRALILLAAAALVEEPLRLLENAKPGSVAAHLIAPVWWLERLFVREPHPQMVEVAVCAFNAALENDD